MDFNQTLTPNGSAVATNADSPFGGQADGTISSILDYGIVQSVTFSTNTTVVVQISEGCTIPTSGGVSAVSYSSAKAPFGFPNINELRLARVVFHANVTGLTGTTSVPVAVPGLTVTFTLYKNATVRTTLTGTSFYNTASAAYVIVMITNGAVSSANKVGVLNMSFQTTSQEQPLNITTEVDLPAGTYTFNVGTGTNAGTTVFVATGTPLLLTADIV